MQPQFLNDWKAKLWSRFFCLSVYITMYLNDNQRSEFYESLGLNTKQVMTHRCSGTCNDTGRRQRYHHMWGDLLHAACLWQLCKPVAARSCVRGQDGSF